MTMKPISDVHAAMNRRTALANALRIGLVTAGIGAGARGFQGLLNLGRRNLTRTPPANFGTRVLDIPVADNEKEKQAGTEAITDALRGATKTPGGWAFALPLAMTAGGAGLVGGYKLTDKLLDSQRKRQVDDELETSKARYEAALQGASKLGQALDELFEATREKTAGSQTLWMGPDTWGKVLGGAATLAIPAALASGLIAYDLTKKKNPETILRKAKEKRRFEQFRKQPSPVYVRPFGHRPTTDADEMDGEPLDKVAAASGHG